MTGTVVGRSLAESESCRSCDKDVEEETRQRNREKDPMKTMKMMKTRKKTAMEKTTMRSNNDNNDIREMKHVVSQNKAKNAQLLLLPSNGSIETL